MEKIIKVNGMMCPHFEARVNEALNKIDGVKSAESSYEKKEVKVVLNKEISDDILEQTIIDAGYEVIK